MPPSSAASQPVLVEEPDDDDALLMLRALRPKYEAHHKVQVEDSALEAAVKLSRRYISDRHLPDKAVDLVDESASKKRIDSQRLPASLKDMEASLQRLENEEEACCATSRLSARCRTAIGQIALAAGVRPAEG